MGRGWNTVREVLTVMLHSGRKIRELMDVEEEGGKVTAFVSTKE